MRLKISIVMDTEKIVLPLVSGKMKSFNLNDILFCKSNGYHTELYYKNNNQVSSLLVNRRLGTIEELFQSTSINSYRTHRSYLVNIDNLEHYGKYPKNELQFPQGVIAKLSRRKKLHFHKYFKSFSEQDKYHL